MDDDLPRYREAYPELDVALVGSGRDARSGIRRVTWYTEWNHIAGNGELQWQDSDQFLISCEFYPREYIQGTQKTRSVYYGFLSRGLEKNRTCAICPVCAKFVVRLYFHIDDWACANCQGLRHRSTFIQPQKRWAEEHANLHLETKDGRPFGMSEVTFNMKLARKRELDSKLVGERTLPARHFLYSIHAEWEAREKSVQGNRW